MVYSPIPYYSINQLQVTVALSQESAAGAIVKLQVVFLVLFLNSTNFQVALLRALSTTGLFKTNHFLQFFNSFNSSIL